MIGSTVIAFGILTLALIAIGAIGTLLKYEWDDRATQGTIYFSSLGVSMIFFGALIL